MPSEMKLLYNKLLKYRWKVLSVKPGKDYVEIWIIYKHKVRDSMILDIGFYL
jgi:hypothetical protein